MPAAAQLHELDLVSAIQLNVQAPKRRTPVPKASLQRDWVRRAPALKGNFVGDISQKRFVHILHNHQDIEYTGKMTLGGQEVRAILDTGSFETLVISQHCKSWSCSNNKHFYDDLNSKTFRYANWTRQHSFGSGECNSRLAWDRLEVGPLAVPNQSFWEVIDADMPILRDGTFEAIVGMSHPNEPIIQILEYLKDDGQLIKEYVEKEGMPPAWVEQQLRGDEQFYQVIKRAPTVLKSTGITTFSVCFKPHVGSEGYWIWNDLPPDKLSSSMFAKVPVTGKTQWSAPLTGVQIMGGNDNVSVSLGCGGPNCTVLFDTGTSLITAPSRVQRNLIDKFHTLGFDCNRLSEMPDLVLTVNGVRLIVPPQEYIGLVEGFPLLESKQFFPQLVKLEPRTPRCTILVMSMDLTTSHGPMWILGMPIFRQYYVTFHLGDDPSYSSLHINRSIYLTPHGGSCAHPLNSTRATLFAVRPIARKLNVSQVRIPSCARKAHKTSVELSKGSRVMQAQI